MRITSIRSRIKNQAGLGAVEIAMVAADIVRRFVIRRLVVSADVGNENFDRRLVV